jgi:phage-related baseplate assembly protein
VVSNPILEFPDESVIANSLRSQVLNSIECINEEPLNATSQGITNEELKERAKAYYAAQNRAVTKQDYESLIYQMPRKFGAVTRANIVNDPSSTNRNIDIYVISEDNNGRLAKTNQVIKNNIKNYLSHYIPINDSVTLKDAFVVNFGLEFTVLNDKNYDSQTVLFRCQEKIKEYFSEHLYIGEPLYLSRLYEIINNVEGVYDVKRVKAFNKTNGNYSQINYNMENSLSKDGSYYKIPKNIILEIKYPNIDIKGTVK